MLDQHTTHAIAPRVYAVDEGEGGDVDPSEDVLGGTDVLALLSEVVEYRVEVNEACGVSANEEGEVSAEVANQAPKLTRRVRCPP